MPRSAVVLGPQSIGADPVKGRPCADPYRAEQDERQRAGGGRASARRATCDAFVWRGRTQPPQARGPPPRRSKKARVEAAGTTLAFFDGRSVWGYASGTALGGRRGCSEGTQKNGARRLWPFWLQRSARWQRADRNGHRKTPFFCVLPSVAGAAVLDKAFALATTKSQSAKGEAQRIKGTDNRQQHDRWQHHDHTGGAVAPLRSRGPKGRGGASGKELLKSE